MYAIQLYRCFDSTVYYLYFNILCTMCNRLNLKKKKITNHKCVNELQILKREFRKHKIQNCPLNHLIFGNLIEKVKMYF